MGLFFKEEDVEIIEEGEEIADPYIDDEEIIDTTEEDKLLECPEVPALPRREDR